MRILTADILPSLCHFMDLHELARMCAVNRFCSRYLLCGHGARHWSEAGKALCGEEYWNDELFDAFSSDEHYKTKLHVCPWLSIPRELQITGLAAYCHLGSDYRIQGMRVLNDFESPLDAELEYKVMIRGNQNVRPGLRVICMTARDESAPAVLVRDPREDMFEISITAEQERLLNELNGDPKFTAVYRRYGMKQIVSVHTIHRGMFAVVFLNARVWDHMSIMFFAAHDRLNALWEIKVHCGEMKAVAFLPGEMWLTTMFESVHYYGPCADRHIIATDEGKHARALWATIAGNAAKAVKIMERGQLDFCRGGLTLFDFAADPTGDDAWKFKSGLPPDAELLMKAEPRFQRSLFMLKRAIYSNDVEAIRRTGRKRVANVHVMESMSGSLDDAIRLLRRAGVRIV